MAATGDATRPVMVGTTPYPPGDIIPCRRLRLCMHLTAAGLAEPADAATSRDIELALLLRAVIPPTTRKRA